MKVFPVVISLAGAVLAGHQAGKRADHVEIAHHLRSANETIEDRSLAKRETYGSEFNNRFTYYAVGLGACGDWNVPSDYIVAMNSGRFQQNGGYAIYPPCICGMQIEINVNGQTAVATVKDECPTCPGIGDLDLSQGLFERFASTDAGVIYGASWTVIYDPCNPNGNPPPQHNPPPQQSPSSSDQNTPTSTSTSTQTSTSTTTSTSTSSPGAQEAPVVFQNLDNLGQAVAHLGRMIWQAAGRQGGL